MNHGHPDVIGSWLKFLHPQSLRSSLISASLYLAAWETFEHGVVGHLEGLYINGFDEDGHTFSDAYQTDVLSRDKSPFRAAMLWFKEHNVVDDCDLALADRAREHRNDIAHNLPAYVAKASHNVDIMLLGDLCKLLSKIDIWWIRNVEIPTNPDFDDQDDEIIPDSEITSGNILFLSMLFNIATGNDADATQFYDRFVETLNKQREPRVE